MKPLPQANEFIAEQLQEWSEEVQKLLRSALANHKVGVTNDLLKSLSYRVLKSAGVHKGELDLHFLEYGRFVDMGVGRGRGLGITESKAVKDAVVRKRDKSGRFVGTMNKPKRWYSKTVYGSLSKLSVRIASNYVEWALKNIKAEIKE